MRNYEIAFIVHPDLEETAFNEVLEKVKGWIGENGGKVTNVDLWGKRKLAYEIRNQSEGQYVFIQSEIEPSSLAALERNLRLQESIMRFMISSATPPTT